MEVDRCRKRMEMTSMLFWHPGFESVCLNSWVLATATIGLKTKQKKAFTTLTVGNLKNLNLRGATAESEITPS